MDFNETDPGSVTGPDDATDHGIVRGENGQQTHLIEFGGADVVEGNGGGGGRDSSNESLRGTSDRSSNLSQKEHGERNNDYYVKAKYEHRSGDETGVLTVNSGWQSEVRIFAHSGYSEWSGYNRLPDGVYDIIAMDEAAKYRLEAQDGKYGNDEVDVPWSILERIPFDLTHPRAHGPGISVGCLAAGVSRGDTGARAHADWRSVAAVIDRSYMRQTATQKMFRWPKGATFGGIKGEEPGSVLGILEVAEVSSW